MDGALNDLRRSGALATSVAAGLVAVLLVGVIAVLIRAPGGSSRAGTNSAKRVPAGWVRVVDRSVGFTAWLPSPPKDGPPSPTAGGLVLTVARTNHRVAIARITIPDSSAAGLAHAFRGVIDSLAWGAGFQVDSEGATTFRGHLARQGLYVTDNGTYYRAVIFIADAGDAYLIASPAPYFKAVTTSFRILGGAGRSSGQ